MAQKYSTTSEILSVLIVDDSPLFQHLIRELLDRHPDIHVADAALNGEQAFIKARAIQPRVILLDLDMQIFTNPYAIAHLRAKSPASLIVAMTMLHHFDPQQIQNKFGVDVVLSKANLNAELTAAILEKTAALAAKLDDVQQQLALQYLAS
jgi:DNA-binding NarL/FixJ family response regulator